MPLRRYVCEAGCEVEVMEGMHAEALKKCQGLVGTPDGLRYCGKPTERVMQPTQRPIVKGGTKRFHEMSE